MKTLNEEESQETEAIGDFNVTSSTGKMYGLTFQYHTPGKIYQWELRIQLHQIRSKVGNIWRESLIKHSMKKYWYWFPYWWQLVKTLEPLEVIPSKDGGSFAFRILLGWCIVGPIGETACSTTGSCNRISFQYMASKTITITLI